MFQSFIFNHKISCICTVANLKSSWGPCNRISDICLSAMIMQKWSPHRLPYCICLLLHIFIFRCLFFQPIYIINCCWISWTKTFWNVQTLRIIAHCISCVQLLELGLVHWLVHATFSGWSLVSSWWLSIVFYMRHLVRRFSRLFLAIFWWFRYKFSCFLC